MGTQPRLPALMKPAAAVAMLIATACGPGGSNTVASHTPTPAASASTAPSGGASGQPSASPTSPPPVSTPYGVLVGSQAASSYTVTLVGVDGHVAASAEATTPPVTSCGTAAAAIFPLPVSTSNSRLYFMDGQGVVHYLGPNGDTGKATTVPAPTSSRRATFAVSPDDRRIAVVVASYTSTGASTSLYVEDLAGGNRINLFSQTGAKTLWAVGWHGTNNLVLAVVASCTQGGGPFCCGMGEIHVVDPATATRRFTLGSYGSCPIAGPPSPAGVVCTTGPDYTSATYLSWVGATVKTLALNGPSSSFVNPGGTMVAIVDSSGTNFTIGAPTIPGMYACGWIDDTHVLAGGDAQHQPRVAEVINSTIVPVAAVGDCGGRLPGGL